MGGWVEESGVGERTRSSPSCSAAREITHWAVREEIAALGGGPAARAASFLPHRRRFEESGGGALAFWTEGARWD